MKRDKRQAETPKPWGLEKMADDVRKASPDEFRKMEKRIFNDPNQPPEMSSLWLEVMRRKRGGAPPGAAIPRAIVSQPDFLYRQFPPLPWAGTDAEFYLRKTGIPENLWADVWSKVAHIVKLRKQPKPHTPPPPSKLARQYRQQATRNRKAGDIARAENCELEAAGLAVLARQQKHHSMDQSTSFLWETMQDIQVMTGKWHDAELAALLRCAGYPENLARPEVLRSLRAKHKNR